MLKTKNPIPDNFWQKLFRRLFNHCLLDNWSFNFYYDFMKSLIKVFCLFILFIPLFPIKASASEEFETNYQVTMEAYPSGQIEVTQKISLKNKLTNIYATSYSLSIEKVKIREVSAFDDFGPMKVDVAEDENQTKLTVNFNRETVGQGKSFSFTIKYLTNDFLHHSGQIWELNIPKLGAIDDIDGYELSIKVPQSFGNPAYFSPNYLESKKENQWQIFLFNKNQLQKTGVIAAFGDFQVYNFTLNYHLENKESNPVMEQIALPPDTEYQKVKYFSFNPEPQKMDLDDDGNWLASFLLKEKESLEVIVSGQVKLFANPVYNFPQKPDLLSKFKEEREFWPVNDPEIQVLAKKLQTPKAIYDYVVNTLSYDYSRARVGSKRMGAKEILSNPERAICMEFTDLFITLARAANIPAREINGYAYTDNPRLKPLSLAQDVLHSWPEYWDENSKRWIQVDPTWQKTSGGLDYFQKLDQNHFAFVIHGLDSRLPLPAGAYKLNETSEKDVSISFGVPIEEKTYLPELTLIKPENIFSEIPFEIEVKIFNSSSQAFYDSNLVVEGDNLVISPKSSTDISVLLPKAEKKLIYKVSFRKPFFQGEGKIYLFLNGINKEYNIKIKSLILGLFLPVFGGALGIISIAIITIKIRRLYLLGRQKSNNLHW